MLDMAMVQELAEELQMDASIVMEFMVTDGYSWDDLSDDHHNQ